MDLPLTDAAYATWTNIVLSQRKPRSSQSTSRTEFYGLRPRPNPYGITAPHPTNTVGLSAFLVDFFNHPYHQPVGQAIPLPGGWHDNRPKEVIQDFIDHLPPPYKNVPGFILPPPYNRPPACVPIPAPGTELTRFYKPGSAPLGLVFSHYYPDTIKPIYTEDGRDTRTFSGIPMLYATAHKVHELPPIPLAAAGVVGPRKGFDPGPGVPWEYQPWTLPHLVPRQRNLTFKLTPRLYEPIERITDYFRILSHPNGVDIANTPTQRLAALLEAIGLRWLTHPDIPLTWGQPPHTVLTTQPDFTT